jgi:hypothetical protein
MTYYVLIYEQEYWTYPYPDSTYIAYLDASELELAYNGSLLCVF